MNKFCILVCLSLFVLCCNGQERKFSYKKVPIEYSQKQIETLDVSHDSTFFDLTTILPLNYVKDGSDDYTEYLQRGIDSHSKIIFPNFPLLINERGLKLKSNSVLHFPSESLLVLKPNKLASYQILLIKDKKNVTLFDVKIKGDRDKHIGEKGEWGMGVSILGSKNISLINPQISHCWGDAIYIGSSNNTSSEKISIKNAKLDYNRRNGISIISCNDLELIDPIISNTDGTLPMSGIDIEPNHNTDIIDNISIINPVTFNNSKDGILIVLTRLPVMVGKKKVNVKIENHIDDSSFAPVRLGSGFRKDGNALEGSIKFINSTWINNDILIRLKGDYTKLPKTSFEGVKIIKHDSKTRIKQTDELKNINSFINKQNNIKITY